MHPWRQLIRGLRALWRPGAHHAGIQDELEHYLAEAAAEQQRSGLDPDLALRAARLHVGSITAAREAVRSSGWEHAVETLAGDLRHAVRRMLKRPGFAAVAAATLGLGLGATTAIFSAINPVLLRPLPYPDADRLVRLWDRGPENDRADLTFGNYRELAERTRSFAAMAVMRPWQPTLSGGAEPDRVEGQRVSAAFFRVLGVQPSLGRGFTAEDDAVSGGRVVILADGLWHRRFSADPTLVGSTIPLDGDAWTVIGVMPPDFENVLSPGAQLWAPLQYDMSQGRAWGHHLGGAARLRTGTTLEAAQGELAAIGVAPVPEFPRVDWSQMERGLLAVPLQADLARGVRPMLLAIMAAAALVLAIACLNVANLLLARGVQRQGEFALRTALGAGRGRLIRQLGVESVLLAGLGAVAGLGLAWVGVRAIVVLSPAGLPRLDAIALDGAAFGFAFAVAGAVALAFGLGPALQAVRADPQAELHLGSSRSTGGHQRARGVLVVVEVGLAIVLLVTSGLLLRSLQRLLAVDAGFVGDRVLTMRVQVAGPRFADGVATGEFFQRALEEVRRVPGVLRAGLTSQLPLSGDLDLYGVHFEPAPPGDPGETRGSFRYAVSPGYLETMGVPLRAGRLIGDRDDAAAPRVALVSESLARRRLPGLDPIGRRLRVGDGPAYTVVGVVGDVKQVSLALSDAEAVYVPAAQLLSPDNAMSLVVESRGDPAELAAQVRGAVWSVDRDQAIVRVATMRGLLNASAAERRFALLLFQAFALASLVLAAVGIYGVLASAVAERTREIGVRSALGATRGTIVGLVLGQGMRLTGIGAGIGLLAAAAASRAIEAMLFGVSRLDPLTYAAVVLLLGAVAAGSCLVPAWRASRVDPAITLRAE